MSFTTRLTVLEKVKDGSQIGWEEFEHFYRPLIMLRGRDRGLYPDELNDLVQHVLINLYQTSSVDKYDDSKGRFRDYLKTVTDRRAIELIRKRKGNQHSLDSLGEQGMDLPSVDHEQAEKRWENEWHKHILEQAIEAVRPEVSPMIYEAFCMSVIDNMPGDHVSKELGISIESVYVAKHRFIKRLKPVLKRLEEED